MFSSTIKIISLLFLLLSIFINPVSGEPVNLKVSNNITAVAEFYPGDKNKPYILILHGFLLNHNFPTIRRLAESLNQSGYNVLTPSLSLGISQRKKSLACEAIHTHSAEKDIQEIALWTKWLQKKSAKDIILIGHSVGAIHLAYYLSQHPSSTVKKIIFIAMPNFNYSSFSKQTSESQNKAEQLFANNDFTLHNFKLAYCEQYPSNAENYLSYLHLTKENIHQFINKISVPQFLIKGSTDKRIDHQWIDKLAHHNINVINVDSANHFFDYEHEFDLLDITEDILNEK